MQSSLLKYSSQNFCVSNTLTRSSGRSNRYCDFKVVMNINNIW